MNFRCYDQLSLKLADGGGIFVGKNAQGKTSILEAICVLMRLQSPRSNKPQDFVQFDQNFCGVSGEYQNRDYRFAYGQLDVKKRGAIAEFRVDGDIVKKNADYLQDSGLVVWMGNADLELIRGGGEGRRRYLDFLGVQLSPEYRLSLRRYVRALKSRNALLKVKMKVASPRGDDEMSSLQAFTNILIEDGEKLSIFRRELIGWLNPFVAAAMAKISETEENLSLVYRSSIKESFREELEHSFERDSRMGITSVGPHRDEIILKVNDLKVKDFGSEGQQRSVAIALKLAQGELLREKSQKQPLYLIDDVFGELDHQRRNAMLKAIPNDAQKFITTTHSDWMNEGMLAEIPVHEVDGGTVKPL